jgi:hypothetical protein
MEKQPGASFHNRSAYPIPNHYGGKQIPEKQAAQANYHLDEPVQHYHRN